MNRSPHPHDSLALYFDELLREEPAPQPVADAPDTAYADDLARQQKLQRLLRTTEPAVPPAADPVPAVEAPAMEAPAVEAPAAPSRKVVVEPEPVLEAATSPVSQLEGLEWLPNGRPAWAQTRFDVLLFKVSGLTLAVPLISLGQIQPLTDELTPLFGQADWFMGLQPTPAGKIRTVNTAKFVMPERYDESFVKSARYVVSINGVPWGLAVDSVNQPINLAPDDVKWRSERSKRPWLAGTVKEHMCALLDIPRIGQLLLDADRNAGKRRA